ncbi:rna-binding protein [Diplodia corticola]|uniref:Rna-binding protein n=1 Tax=Diplodia corticola TaxID=236234 RepID=A0A1J9RR66_9PEZI|nr:rna-binding protein [Diplodia corticola]OJD30919.1 rna-binding protein [Diplodia corticola]
MTTLPCPLPQVEEALRPYIHTRQETLRIRKTLAQHLQSQMHRTERQHGAESATPITSLTLACAPPSLLLEHDQTRSASAPLPPPPPELTGLRKQYWEAVRAHALAKHRWDALRGELTQLQREAHTARAAAETGPAADVGPYSSSSSAAPVVGHSGGHQAGHDVQNYVALLHQRRRHARLQVLLDALDRAADAEPDDDPLRRDDLRQWVKDRLGDAPVPPPEIAGGGHSAVGDASASAAAVAADQTKDHVLRLKKELLLAKQDVDAETQRRKAVAHESTGGSTLSRGIEAQVRALRAARDELIAWIEGELAKMPEGDESILSNGGTPQRPDRRDDKDAAASGLDDDAESIQEQVDALYERYVAARTSLVAAVDAATASAKELNAPSTLPGSNQRSGSGDGGEAAGQRSQQLHLPPSAALPFVPALLRCANDERILTQQIATHLRHQIAAAQEEARNTAQRLASESHLVGPDAESGGAWARAAKEATRETDEAILERVRAAQANVEGAKDILAELDRRREGFRALRGEA